ncbi:MAG: hydantoinase/oxoprolinase family protein [Pseudomonadota bacterium]
MKVVGIDVGGTFTDLIWIDPEGGAGIHKVPTTSEDPSKGVISGLNALMTQGDIGPNDISNILHGTTTATNTVLEKDGARTGMITNEGFRDILHIGRHQRPEHYSIMQEIPWQNRPLIQRRYRKTVSGRLVPPSGEELEPLDEAAVRSAAQELRDEGVEAIAICFLFSYLNPSHENRAKAIVRDEIPDAFVTTSTEISPQFREFERFTTAALATFVGPKVGRYISRLEQRFKDKGIEGDLRIMASNGGVVTPRMVAQNPALTMMSGLAAGVLGGAWIGLKCGRNKVISFDIGGTSADIGIAIDGVCAETDARSTSIAGFPLLMPMLDIHTLGAGGGSIAYVDQGGAFRVGPQSAGAVPGPAAYGQGGDKPTVTDANLVLGRLEARDFLGGDMRLDVDASRAVIDELADQLKINPLEAAEGVLTILNANMANAIRSRTIQRGIDPREFSIVAMGGAGPLQGAEVARMLGVPEVIVPPHPGVTSALGLLIADLKYDVIRTLFQVSNSADLDRFNQTFTEMQATLMERLGEDGLSIDDITFQRAGDLRYVGQGYELRVPFDAGCITKDSLQTVWQRFHDVHAQEYGRAFGDNPVEVVNLRLTAHGASKLLDLPPYAGGQTCADALLRSSDAVFRQHGKLQTFKTDIYRRDALPVNVPIAGPAVLLQKDSTTVVPPDAEARVHASGSVIVTLEDIA